MEDDSAIISFIEHYIVQCNATSHEYTCMMMSMIIISQECLHNFFLLYLLMHSCTYIHSFAYINQKNHWKINKSKVKWIDGKYVLMVLL